MKKIPSLFERDWENDRSRVTREVTPEGWWVAAGYGTPTRKRDGTACMVRDGRLFKRYDAKQGKVPPAGFEPCQDPDTITGHWPGWVPVGEGGEDKHFRAAWDGCLGELSDGTYELCGPKIGGNPEGLEQLTFYRHGDEVLPADTPRDYDGLRAFFETHAIEGIVWHAPTYGMVKIKARDFGLAWPRKVLPNAQVSGEA